MCSTFDITKAVGILIRGIQNYSDLLLKQFLELTFATRTKTSFMSNGLEVPKICFHEECSTTPHSLSSYFVFASTVDTLLLPMVYVVKIGSVTMKFFRSVIYTSMPFCDA